MVVEIKHRFRLRPVGFRFDAQSVFFLCQMYKVNLDSLDKIPQGEYVNSWVWCAHCSYCLTKYRKPMSYEKMKRYIFRLCKGEWDSILTAITEARSEGSDKKKVLTGENSLSQDGKQD